MFRNTPMTVVADDDPVSLKLMTHAIESLGHYVVAAPNGRTALSIIEHNPVDLLVTDIMMPDLSGSELIGVIRGREDLRDLPVMVCSGVVRLSDIAQLLQQGASRFLPKPVTTVDLQRYVLELLPNNQKVRVS